MAVKFIPFRKYYRSARRLQAIRLERARFSVGARSAYAATSMHGSPQEPDHSGVLRHRSEAPVVPVPAEVWRSVQEKNYHLSLPDAYESVRSNVDARQTARA
jgi:hypothetical protein